MQQSLFNSFEKPKKSEISRSVLNSSQYEAVTTTEGPVLVIAGAGSGKTRTLVYRTAHLVEKGIDPKQILLLTFTRKAAQEMVNRASQIIGESCKIVTGGTFHAVASMLLRKYCYFIDYAPNFTIIDQSDAAGIINLLKVSLGFSGYGKKFPSQKMIVNTFSQAVNKNVPLTTLLSDRYMHLAEFNDELLIVKKHYEDFKLEHNLMDYDDLLVNWKKILAKQEGVRREVSDRFKYVMVDEYQDTNHLQADIVKLIAGEKQNVMVVGDDSQSIYSFRGADFKNIMEFPNVFPNTTIIRLEENYRSTQPILSMTNAIIEKAAEKYTKTLYSNIEGGKKPVVHGARDEADQARFIITKLMDLHKKGVPYSKMAVLFRSGFHSYKLEMELTKMHIDFEKRGGLKLTESAHNKDVISYLRIITNINDQLSWNRILLLLEKVGPKTAQRVLETIKGTDEVISTLRKFKAGPTWKNGFDELLDFIEELMKPALTPLEQFEIVMDYYTPILERVYSDDFPSRAQDLEHLKSIMAETGDLQSFMDSLALDPPENSDVLTGGASKGEDRLVLSTVHSAKGLEWDTVFIINLAEGKFPSAMARLAEELEEERRLLYVAATRAEKRLYMVYPRMVLSPKRYSEPALMSQFLAEIPSGLTAVAGFSEHDHLRTPKYSSYSPRKSVQGEVEVGGRVRHPFFGDGKVEKKVGPRTVMIFFPRHGVKTINLDYAKVEVIE